MKIFITLCFVFCISFIKPKAQVSVPFKPSTFDSINLSNIQQQVFKQYISDSANSTNVKYKEYYQAAYKSRWEFLKAKFRYREFIYTQPLQDYFTTILNEIVKNNTELQQLPIRLLISKSYIPNAASMGDGTLFYQAGLFYKLRNEAEVAFALSHELAHLYLNHSKKSIDEYVSSIAAEEYQKKVKEILKSEYQQGKMIDELEKKLDFRSKRHSRQHELESDSMAVIFLKNTSYDIKVASLCLSSLDSIDNNNFDIDKKLPEIFNFADYQFQVRWLQKEEGLFGSEKSDFIKHTQEEDSLKTHPDCKLRLEKIIPLTNKHFATGKRIYFNKENFESIQEQLHHEAIDYCYKTNQISRCLFLSLQLLNERPTDSYLITMIGNCFYQFYQKQKEHSLGTVVDMPSYIHEKNYNRLLEFIQNLKLWDIAGIGHHFLNKNRDVCKDYEPFYDVNTNLIKLYKKEFQ